MGYCARCGTRWTPTARFCGQCGAPRGDIDGEAPNGAGARRIPRQGIMGAAGGRHAPAGAVREGSESVAARGIRFLVVFGIALGLLFWIHPHL